MNQSTAMASEPMAIQPAKMGGVSGYIISSSATATVHSMARNAVLVPISQGTEVTIVTE